MKEPQWDLSFEWPISVNNLIQVYLDCVHNEDMKMRERTKMPKITILKCIIVNPK